MKKRTTAILGAVAGVVATVAVAGTVAIAHGGRGAHMERLCGDDRMAHIERAMTEARQELALKPQQEPAFAELEAAVERGNGIVAETCGRIEGAERPDNPVEHLARAETFMSAGLEVVQTVRPAFEDLYATLDDTQRDKLDAFMREHRGKRGHHHGDD